MIEAKGFSLGEILNFGWKRFTEHWSFLLGFSIVSLLIQFSGAYLISLIPSEHIYGLIASQIALSLVGMVITLGGIKVCLDVADRKTPSWSSLFSQWKQVFQYLIAAFLFFLTVLLGTLLFVIPGIVWLFKYMFFPYVIVERGLGPIAALKESSKLTDGSKWDLFGWFVTIMTLFMGVFFSFVFLPLMATQVLFRSPNINYYISQQNLGIIIALFCVVAVIFYSLVVGVMTASIYRRLQKNLSPELKNPES